MKTLRTLGLIATLLAAQGLAHASNDAPVQVSTQAHQARQASGQPATAAFHLQVAAVTLGLAAPAAFAHTAQDAATAPAPESQPSGSLLLLAGLALLGAVIYRCLLYTSPSPRD